MRKTTLVMSPDQLRLLRQEWDVPRYRPDWLRIAAWGFGLIFSWSLVGLVVFAAWALSR